ncbi:uroporphyrinogen-III C-methyltransferase [Entomomonas asaccharolytica]|uniref:Uroporphyrinogen-III C-methyltransferase n=1 Tax=Entomomonas asaccharolytica TaxID=2785331 RepID=A0A974NF08_9GAMM|nr:uroporphyrinogen-III C-methyltransferase [Entomomonas asaccharolytica]QQP85217.1 uroporphyrinogen-III C-methyltransferase [Entomomonas asaccharolytica]
MNKQTDPQQNESVEANNPKAKVTSNPSEPPKTTSTKNKTHTAASVKANSTMIAGLALVIAIIGCGGAGYTYWQIKNQNNLLADQNTSLTTQLAEQQQKFDQALQQFSENTKQQEASLRNQLADTQSKLKDLGAETSKVKASQENVITQVAKVNADSSQTWMLFEAKQILKQAFFRLRASDVNGASKLLDDLNETIKLRGDLSQTASKVNQTIETALLKLQQAEQVDRANLYSQLAAIQTQIAELKVKQPVFQKQDTSQEKPTNRFEALADKLSNYVRVDFNANSKVLPILTSQGFGQLKMTLNLAIEKAQWAALNGESDIYKSELTRVAELLEQYFDADTTAVSALITKIEQLKNKTIITEVPDITDTLQFVNSYLDEQISLNTPQQTVTQPTGGNNQ